MSFTLTSIGTPGSGYDFARGDSSDVETFDQIDPVYQQLLDGPVTVTLATQASDGRMQLNAMWMEVSPDRRSLHINTAKGRAKDRQMRKTPTISVQAINPQNPYHWVTAYGTVEKIVEESDAADGKLATESINRLAKVYLGADEYPLRGNGEERVLFVVRPTKLVTFGTP
jgi:PPOX class probable F420-dependent enzyme